MGTVNRKAETDRASKGPPAPLGALIAGDGNAVPFYLTHEDSLRIQQQVEFGGQIIKRGSFE